MGTTSQLVVLILQYRWALLCMSFIIYISLLAFSPHVYLSLFSASMLTFEFLCVSFCLDFIFSFFPLRWIQKSCL